MEHNPWLGYSQTRISEYDMLIVSSSYAFPVTNGFLFIYGKF